MLTVHQLSKSYGIDPLFENVSFTVNPGERIGLVGPNGCGKSTLLRILIGQEQAAAGSVRFSPSNLRIGYLAQGLNFDPGDTFGSYIDRMAGNVQTLSARLEELAVQLAARPGDAVLQQAYDDTLDRLALADESAGLLEGILAALGLNEMTPDLPVAALSGGQKTRLALAGILVAQPQLLLLDEPTNHLDLDMLAWLERWLLAYPYAALVVSHDRAFLDHTTTAILELDPLTRTARRYEGNYSAYIEQKAAERERQWQAYKDQQEEIRQLTAAAARVRSRAVFRKGGKADQANTDGFSVGFFANRSKETVARAKHIEQRIERLLNEDRVEKPGRVWQMKMEFGQVSSSGRDTLILEELTIGYGERALVREINGVVRYGQRLALIGPNGAGKTTLLRTIAGQIPPLAGQARLGANVHLGYMAQEQENLDGSLTPLETISRLLSQSETEQRAFLSKFLFKGDDVFKSIARLSYGERARLTLACLVAQGCNCLLLDEPINHLDIPSRAQFEQALAAFEGTILAVVHDRYFIAGFATRIWEIRGGNMREVYFTQ